MVSTGAFILKLISVHSTPRKNAVLVFSSPLLLLFKGNHPKQRAQGVKKNEGGEEKV